MKIQRTSRQAPIDSDEKAIDLVAATLLKRYSQQHDNDDEHDDHFIRVRALRLLRRCRTVGCPPPAALGELLEALLMGKRNKAGTSITRRAWPAFCRGVRCKALKPDISNRQLAKAAGVAEKVVRSWTMHDASDDSTTPQVVREFDYGWRFARSWWERIGALPDDQELAREFERPSRH